MRRKLRQLRKSILLIREMSMRILVPLLLLLLLLLLLPLESQLGGRENILRRGMIKRWRHTIMVYMDKLQIRYQIARLHSRLYSPNLHVMDPQFQHHLFLLFSLQYYSKSYLSLLIMYYSSTSTPCLVLAFQSLEVHYHCPHTLQAPFVMLSTSFSA